MQKFTIFTIILSTLIITVIAELVVQDYLQKVYSPSTQSLQANTLGTSNFDDFIAPFTAETKEDSNASELADRIKALIPKSSDSENDTTSTAEVIVQDTNIKPFARLIQLSPAMQINGLNYQESAYNNKLFQLIDTTTLTLSKTSFANIQVDNTIIGSAYELESRTSVDAEQNFDEIRILANSFPNIDTNQTNQFGDRSFYINHLVKVGEVFLVVQKGTTIYAFSYKKDYHETFKTFFAIFF